MAEETELPEGIIRWGKFHAKILIEAVRSTLWAVPDGFAYSAIFEDNAPGGPATKGRVEVRYKPGKPSLAVRPIVRTDNAYNDAFTKALLAALAAELGFKAEAGAVFVPNVKPS